MDQKSNESRLKGPRGKKAASAIVAMLAGFVLFTVLSKISVNDDSQPDKADNPKAPISIRAKIDPPETEKRVIDFQEKDSAASQRKAAYGLKSGIDFIARDGDTLKVGPHLVSMSEIREKAELARGDILEKQLDEDGNEKTGRVGEYGIHVVKPGDNIWNIHFRFLMDYFESKQTTLSPLSDEPIPSGLSSGVGKLLKFSEKMVIIYNLKDQKIDTSIDIIQPYSKIVVYNMQEIFAFLDSIDPASVGRIRFNGESIWIQAEQAQHIKSD